MQNKRESILFGVLMGAGMSLFMAFAMTLKNVGMNPSFFKIFLGEWAFGFIVALIPSILLPPLIAKFLKRMSRSKDPT